MEGVLIAFEGGDFLGKSTQYKLAMERMKQLYPSKMVAKPLREPGSTDFGEFSRYLILNPKVLAFMLRIVEHIKAGGVPLKYPEFSSDLEGIISELETSRGFTDFAFSSKLSSLSEAYLFQTSRAQLWEEKIIPWLNRGKIVLVDRCGFSSSVYQGIVRGLGPKWIESLNNKSTNGFRPHLTILFNIEPDKGVEWIKSNSRRKNDEIDREELEFHHRVFEAYNALPKILPKPLANTFRIIDFGKYINLDKRESITRIHNVVMQYITSFLEDKGIVRDYSSSSLSSV